MLSLCERDKYRYRLSKQKSTDMSMKLLQVSQKKTEMM